MSSSTHSYPSGRGVIQRIRNFWSNSNGTSAVEFAFILPIMVVLYFGCVEVSQAVSVNRKVTAVSSAAGDLIAQASSISNSEMSDIFDAAEAIIVPFGAAPLEIVVSSVVIDSDGNATVDWSDGHNATKRSDGETITLPTSLAIPDTSLIMTEVKYTYTSIFADYFSGPINLDETFYLRPRKVNAVERTS